MLCVFGSFCFVVGAFWFGFVVFENSFCLVTVCAQDKLFLLLEKDLSITLGCILAIEDDVRK